ncbi:hypothetical protein KR51_00021090 [Rubidibacter lacunae KORDI 51-2]|uniref:Uncharacterized protein n=1 Tax=Rubidibacter lacunae KORDI 51-2 TaxID=582515 RepID=U5D9P2_9CHRO|nr:hypothetical protein KR51_00021090 [Rubidibacter lacunae KORDI 51-2]
MRVKDLPCLEASFASQSGPQGMLAMTSDYMQPKKCSNEIAISPVVPPLKMSEEIRTI